MFSGRKKIGKHNGKNNGRTRRVEMQREGCGMLACQTTSEKRIGNTSDVCMKPIQIALSREV